MNRHFHEELSALKNEVVRMGDLVQDSIKTSLKAVFSRDDQRAVETLQQEQRINHYEIAIDSLSQKLAALNQPVGRDLRMVATFFKINKDLERMGDHATNIAEYALKLNDLPPFNKDLGLKDMSDQTLVMVAKALTAFLRDDVALAKEVLTCDDRIDQANDDLCAQLEAMIENDPQITKIGMALLMIGHNIERIADLSCNIAEDVIFIQQGREIRHRYQSP